MSFHLSSSKCRNILVVCLFLLSVLDACRPLPKKPEMTEKPEKAVRQPKYYYKKVAINDSAEAEENDSKSLVDYKEEQLTEKIENNENKKKENRLRSGNRYVKTKEPETVPDKWKSGL